MTTPTSTHNGPTILIFTKTGCHYCTKALKLASAWCAEETWAEVKLTAGAENPVQNGSMPLGVFKMMFPFIKEVPAILWVNNDGGGNDCDFDTYKDFRSLIHETAYGDTSMFYDDNGNHKKEWHDRVIQALEETKIQ